MTTLHLWLAATVAPLLFCLPDAFAQTTGEFHTDIAVYESYKEQSIPPYLIWQYEGMGSGLQSKTIVDPASQITVTVDMGGEAMGCGAGLSFEAVLVNGEGQRGMPFENVVEQNDQPVASIEGQFDLSPEAAWQKAELDLRLSGANEGDILYIYMEKGNCSHARGHVCKGLRGRMQLGRYKVRKTRWNTRVSDAFVLVNRIGEEQIQNQAEVSPSNFKGAPGAALLYNWYDDGTCDRKQFVGRAMNALEPTVGIHLNYLDFDQGRDLELGTALVLGLFRSQIMLSIGYNLNVDRPVGKPFYMGLGVSFANLAGGLGK